MQMVSSEYSENMTEREGNGTNNNPSISLIGHIGWAVLKLTLSNVNFNLNQKLW